MLGTALLTVAVVTACGADETTTGADSRPAVADTSSGDSAAATNAASDVAVTTYPVAGLHVHGLARDPADRTLYAGTHEGLYSYAGGQPELVSPAMDFMGLAVAGPGEFVASGHAGPGGELPEPMGLIRSQDAGRTWEALSRGGESDFHSLSASGSVVMGYDGALRSTEDGTTWVEATIPEPLADVALSPDAGVALITTESGLQRSQDAGGTWELVPDAPRMIYVEWADADTVVGLSVQDQIMVSEDAGRTFAARGEAPAQDVVAFSASAQGDTLEALVALENEIRVIPLPDQ